jgi:hypothetical protein
MATTLNKGIRLPSDVNITLNNRLFEDEKGTLLFTFRPDEPSSAINGDRLLLGSGDDKGFINVYLSHESSGYRVKVVSNGSNVSTVISPTDLIDYKQEVTIGVVYDSTIGDLKLLVSSEGMSPVDNGSDSTGFFSNTNVGLSSDRDSSSSIGLQDFTGFIGRLATYDSEIDDVALAGFVNDPSSWPADNRVHYLDAANLVRLSQVDASRPSEQELTFGAAQSSGVITVDNVEVFINRGDSGATVAQKVGKALSESPVFRTQVEKQTITFEVGSSSGILIAGVSAGPAATASALATNVVEELEKEENDFIKDEDGNLRSIVNNGDGSITITYTAKDEDADPVSITSSSGATATMETTQLYSASGQGRVVTVDGDKVSIRFNTADGDIPLLAAGSSSVGPKFSAGATGVSINARETKPYIPSEFQFSRDPVSQIQRITLTKDPDVDGPITFGTAGATLLTVSLASADTVLTAVDDIVGASATLTALASFDEVNDGGDTVLIKLNPSAGAHDLLLVDGSAAGTMAVVQIDQQYAENTRGESQTLFFKTPATGRADGTITVGGTDVSVLATDTANSIAIKVEKALEALPAYSTPEEQTIFIRKGSDADGGAFRIAGFDFTASASTSASGIAELIATGFSAGALATIGVASVEADGEAVHFTMTNAHGKSTSLLGAFADNTASASGVLTTPFEISQEYNSEGVRKTTVNGNQLTVEFGAFENNVGGITFTSSASANISASVLQDYEHHTVDLTSSSYTGSSVDPGNAGASIQPSNVLYTELVSVGPAAANGARPVKFNVFVDPAYATDLQGGFESVGFTMNYSTGDFGTTMPTVMMAPGQNSINAQPALGQVAFSWLNSTSVQDFSKPLATITLQQSSQNSNPNFIFSTVNIDGIDFTDAPTVATDDGNARYASSFVDALQTDRWEVSSTLVNALDGTTGIGGQLVGYYANPSVAGAQLKLQFAKLADLGGADPSFDTASKTVSFDVMTLANSAIAAKFTIELPSNTTGASFVRSEAAVNANLTVSSELDGRSLEVTITGTGAGVARGASLGRVDVDLSSALDKTHEFSITPGSATVNGAAVSTIQNLYVGYTKTMVSPTANLKGDWVASDIPKGEFNKFLVGTADTQASTVITTADALQILKLSTGLRLDWKTGEPPVGAFVAADLDGSGKINAADALMALRYATGTFEGDDPVRWAFIDSNTEGATPALGITNALPKPLKTGMQVTGDITEATMSDDFKVEAVLVGNLTNPITDPF